MMKAIARTTFQACEETMFMKSVSGAISESLLLL